MRHPFHLALASLVFPAAAHAQTVLYVNAGLPTGAGTGQSWANAFRGATALQQALDAAAPITGGGQTVQVWTAAGTYVPSVRTNATDALSVTFALLSKVEVYGGFAGGEASIAQRDVVANPTVLSGAVDATHHAYHVTIASGVDTTCILDGFTVSGGVACDVPAGRGGGMYCLSGSPVVRNCRVEGNTSCGNGGGAYFEGAVPRFNDCAFVSNECSGNQGGGAIYSDAETALSVLHCSFTLNRARNTGSGGAIYASGFDADSCSFVQNRAFAGGAVANFGTLTDCTFSGNTGDDGSGAIVIGPYTALRCTFTANVGHNLGGSGVGDLYGSPSTFNGCTFSQNMGGGTTTGSAVVTGPAEFAGCRFLNNPAGPISVRRTAVNCFFSGNAGPIRAESGSSLVNCTISGNTSGGLHQYGSGSATITNCIIWNNTPAGQPQVDPSIGSVVVSYSCVQSPTGPLGGVGNFSADPRLDADGRLLSPSPCIDAGNSGAVPAGITTDLFVQPRFVDDPGMPNTGIGSPPVDIGAFEFQGTSCYANCNGSTSVPTLNVLDFTCFLQAFAGASPYANCDASTSAPALSVLDFTCFLQRFAAGCP